MRYYEVKTTDHSIGISYSFWRPMETITYDGRTVSEKRASPFVTTHCFVVDEDGQKTTYEVRQGGLIGYQVRRNAAVIAAEHRPVMRYFAAVGLIFMAIVFIKLLILPAAVLAPASMERLQLAINRWSTAAVLVGALPVSWWLKLHLVKRNRQAP